MTWCSAALAAEVFEQPEVALLGYSCCAVVAAEVSVRLSQDGRSVTARAADPDTLVASAKAYLSALNKIVMKKQRDMPAVAAAGH